MNKLKLLFLGILFFSFISCSDNNDYIEIEKNDLEKTIINFFEKNKEVIDLKDLNVDMKNLSSKSSEEFKILLALNTLDKYQIKRLYITKKGNIIEGKIFEFNFDPKDYSEDFKNYGLDKFLTLKNVKINVTSLQKDTFERGLRWGGQGPGTQSNCNFCHVTMDEIVIGGGGMNNNDKMHFGGNDQSNGGPGWGYWDFGGNGSNGAGGTGSGGGNTNTWIPTLQEKNKKTAEFLNNPNNVAELKKIFEKAYTITKENIFHKRQELGAWIYYDEKSNKFYIGDIKEGGEIYDLSEAWYKPGDSSISANSKDNRIPSTAVPIATFHAHSTYTYFPENTYRYTGLTDGDRSYSILNNIANIAFDYIGEPSYNGSKHYMLRGGHNIDAPSKIYVYYPTN